MSCMQSKWRDYAILHIAVETHARNFLENSACEVVCVDEKGNVVNGDQILYIYGKYMKQRGKLINNTIVATVMSNFGFFKALDEEGIEYAKTKVGDKYVYEYIPEPAPKGRPDT